MPWDPVQYEKFKKEREAPFEDLLAMIDVREGMSVIDLGCGPGPLTKRLADELPGSDLLGIDSSREMLEQASELARPGLRFEQRAIEDVDGEWDLVFTHAAIQWVPDHAALIPKLLSLVRPGGQLAVQLPSNFSHPTHTLIDEVGAEEPYRSGLDGYVHRWGVLDVEEYAELLHASGGSHLTVSRRSTRMCWRTRTRSPIGCRAPRSSPTWTGCRTNCTSRSWTRIESCSASASPQSPSSSASAASSSSPAAVSVRGR